MNYSFRLTEIAKSVKEGRSRRISDAYHQAATETAGKEPDTENRALRRPL